MPSRLAATIAAILVIMSLPTGLFAHGQQGVSWPELKVDSPAPPPIPNLDSAYSVRKAQVKRWEKESQSVALRKPDSLSIYATLGTLMLIRAGDVNQYFSQRAGRSDPIGDRDEFSGVDRAFAIGGNSQITPWLGVFLEYDFLTRWYNTDILSSPLPALVNAEEEVDLTAHSLIVGGSLTIIESRFVRLRGNAGLGPALSFVHETESNGYSRQSSALGLQISVGLLTDLRFADWGSFLIEVGARSVSEGTLKSAGGSNLSEPFGANPARMEPAPSASYLVGGLSVGLIGYF